MSTMAGLSPTFSHRGRAPTRCTPNRGGRQILHHCSGGCGAAALAQVAGFRSSRGPPCVGGAWPSISSVSPISPISPAAMGRPAAAWGPADDGLCAGAVGRSASNWRFCASSRGGSTSPWAFRRGRRGSDGRSQPPSAARARGLVVVAGPLALTLSRWGLYRAPRGSGRPRGAPLREGIDSRGSGNDGYGRVLQRFPAGAGRDHPRPPAPDAPVARALSQSLPEGERFGDGPLPRSPLILVAWGAGGHKGRPYGEGIDSRGRRNDGYGRVFVEVSSGSGEKPRPANRP